jgi:hypothetical protein
VDDAIYRVCSVGMQVQVLYNFRRGSVPVYGPGSDPVLSVGVIGIASLNVQYEYAIDLFNMEARIVPL